MEGGERRNGKKVKGEGGVRTEAAGELPKCFFFFYTFYNHMHTHLGLFIV